MKQKRRQNSRGRWMETEQDIRDLLAEYSRQDQSVKMFCESRGLAEWRFYSWKKGYGGVQPATDHPAGFVALHVRKMDAPVAAQSGELFQGVRWLIGPCPQ